MTIPRSKHGEKHFVRLNSEARAALDRLRARDRGEPSPGSLVYPREDSRQRRWFQECCLAAGVLNFRWHDLRHTFASRLVMAGVDLRTVSELLGHKTMMMTLRYAHLAPGHLQEALERLVQQPSKQPSSQRSTGSAKADRHLSYVSSMA